MCMFSYLMLKINVKALMIPHNSNLNEKLNHQLLLKNDQYQERHKVYGLTYSIIVLAGSILNRL